jgi:hypothetical protein
MGFRIGRQKVSEWLSELGDSLQGHRKTKARSSHPDRYRPFRFLSRRVKLFQRFSQPVISVDTKKKELIGNYSNKGREWCPKGKPKGFPGFGQRSRQSIHTAFMIKRQMSAG